MNRDYSAVRDVRLYHEGAWRTVRVDIDLDLTAIANASARKALRNKSGKTKLVSGAVVLSARVLPNAP